MTDLTITKVENVLKVTIENPIVTVRANGPQGAQENGGSEAGLLTTKKTLLAVNLNLSDKE